MDQSTLMRRTAFGVIVLVLVALGAYTLGPVAHGAGRPASQGRTSRPSDSRGAPAGSPTASQPVQTGPDIYQWLPFTQAGLAAAASAVTRFGDAYGTFSYTESADSYAASLQAMTAPQLVTQIAAAYSTPGVASARTAGKQVSAGSAVIESLRAFGPTSLTFVVLVTQRLTQQSGRSQVATSYAVTVTGTGTNWQVSDVELAAAGNS
jgi:hypothetical protein